VKLKDILRIVRTPGCWIRNFHTSRVLSAWINEQLDAGYAPVREDHFTITLNGVELWGANWPYAFGTLEGGSELGMPDRTTNFRIVDAMPCESTEERVRRILAKAGAP